jgi:serine protease Do
MKAAALAGSVALAAVWLAGEPGAPAFAQGVETGASAPHVVYCHDPVRHIVQRKLIGDCSGEVVTAERAEEIRAEAIERRRQILAKPRTSVIQGRKLRSIGTGFFVTANGRLLTNNHVVDGCAALSVETPDGRSAEARIVDTRAQDDLALIETPLKSAAVATFLETVELAAGTPIALIGYPDQGLAPIRPLLTRGTLNGGQRLATGRASFEINADVRHGNSGGPVVDARGLVIGVVFAKVNSVAVFQATGKNVRFVGVVIDNSAVLDFLGHNHIAYRKAVSGGALDAADLESHLRGIVVRVGCWG